MTAVVGAPPSAATARAPDPLHVHVAAYEGPVEVLLELISRRRLEVSEISVAQVVDDFLAAVADLSELPLEAASKFLLVAATLIAIKTNRLLPAASEIELDEDLLVDTERDVLLTRLLAARTFKDVATVLHDHLDVGSRFVPRTVQPEDGARRVAPDLLRQVSVDDLASIAARVLAGRPHEAIDLTHVQPIRVTVHQAVEDLCTVLAVRREAGFRSLCRDCTLLEAAVRFVALLELLKAGFVQAEQDGCFDDITVRWVAPVGLVYRHADGGSDGGEETIDLAGAESEVTRR